MKDTRDTMERRLAGIVERAASNGHGLGVAMHADGIMKPVRAALQALLDLFPRTGGGATPQIGTKGKPGPLYGVSSHAWAALGVAVTASHQMEGAA